VYSKVTVTKAHMPNHAPTIIDDAEEAGAILPLSVRRMLARKPKAIKS
jgi:hypothetical protein